VSFRQTNNQHDAWQKYCDRQASVLSEIGLPAALFENDFVLSEFLTKGYRQKDEASLDVLDDDRFCQLFYFATSWFDFDTSGFTAMEVRRIHSNTDYKYM
jgi:hypothetical protein